MFTPGLRSSWRTPGVIVRSLSRPASRSGVPCLPWFFTASRNFFWSLLFFPCTIRPIEPAACFSCGPFAPLPREALLFRCTSSGDRNISRVDVFDTPGQLSVSLPLAWSVCKGLLRLLALLAIRCCSRPTLERTIHPAIASNQGQTDQPENDHLAQTRLETVL
jgi:hypothetical protein